MLAQFIGADRSQEAPGSDKRTADSVSFQLSSVLLVLQHLQGKASQVYPVDSEFASPLVNSEFRLSIFFHVGYEKICINFALTGNLSFIIDSKQVCLLLKKRRNLCEGCL